MAFLRRKLRVEAGVGAGGGGVVGERGASGGRGTGGGEGGGTVGTGGDGGSVFCYVNNVFAPGLDEGVGGLWRVSLNFSLSHFLIFYFPASFLLGLLAFAGFLGGVRSWYLPKHKLSFFQHPSIKHGLSHLADIYAYGVYISYVNTYLSLFFFFFFFSPQLILPSLSII